MNVTKNQLRQMVQISRLDQAVFADVSTRLSRLPSKTKSSVSGRIIGDGLVRAARRRFPEKTTRRPEQEPAPEPVAPAPPVAPWLRTPPVDNGVTVMVPGRVLYDLVIASKKYGTNLTDQAEAPILWWKTPGRPQEFPQHKSLLDSDVQAALLDYELVHQEVKQFQVIRRYRRIK